MDATEQMNNVFKVINTFGQAGLKISQPIRSFKQDGEAFSFILISEVDEFKLTVQANKEVIWNDFTHSTFLFSLKDFLEEDAIADLKFALSQVKAKRIYLGAIADGICDRCNGDHLLCISVLNPANGEGTVTFDVRHLAYELIIARKDVAATVFNIQDLATQWCRLKGYQLIMVEMAN